MVPLVIAGGPGALPGPSGPLAIARTTVHWTDSARLEALAGDRRSRELMVDIWYPGQRKAGPTASYIDVAAFDRSLGSTGLPSLLGAAAAARVRSGGVQTHAIQDAPFARRVKPCPVLIFSHGMGTVSQLYTAQIEDLVSHGYVVVAITHPYDAWLATFPDGRSIPFETERRSAAGNSEEERIAYEDARVEWWASDMRFALTELGSQQRMRARPLPVDGHLDLQRVGAFGHSVGGRAAARACQLDARLRACADQDGVARMQPFHLHADGSGMLQPFLLIERERTTAPTDDELRRMGLTRPEADALMAQLRASRDAALAATGGSYRVVLNFAQTEHMSFSDLPMLEARDAVEAARRARVFEVTSRYTRAFFDKLLRGMEAPLLDEGPKSEFVDSVQRYPKRQGTASRLSA